MLLQYYHLDAFDYRKVLGHSYSQFQWNLIFTYSVPVNGWSCMLLTAVRCVVLYPAELVHLYMTDMKYTDSNSLCLNCPAAKHSGSVWWQTPWFYCSWTRKWMLPATVEWVSVSPWGGCAAFFTTRFVKSAKGQKPACSHQGLNLIGIYMSTLLKCG